MKNYEDSKNNCTTQENFFEEVNHKIRKNLEIATVTIKPNKRDVTAIKGIMHNFNFFWEISGRTT